MRRRFLNKLGSVLRPPVRLAPLHRLDRQRPFDVCIVGSGPAGAVLACDLVQRGWRVLIIESGGRPDQQEDDSVEKLQAYRTSGSVSYPIASSLFHGLGGTSNLWYGGCPRLHPLDFQQNAYTPVGAAWPISYADLEPYYARAESTLRVHGGPLSHYHPPRTGDLPLGRGSDNSSLKSMLREVGLTVDNSPISLGPGGHTFRVSTDLLPRLSANHHRSLICRGTVTRLLPNSTTDIRGAEVMDAGGQRRLVQARVYVVTCGGLETARLLLLSRSPTFPDGIGNRSGLVGRYFMDHFNLTFYGTVPDRDFHGFGRSYQFYEQFKRQGLGSVILGLAEEHRGSQKVLRIAADIEMFPSDKNRASLAGDVQDRFGNPGLDLCLGLSARDIHTLRAVRSLIGRIYTDLGAVNITAHPDQQDDISWLSHHMGTCRMGADPDRSVTDRDLRIHDSPNLYLVGSAVFVTAGAANPTLSIAALSHRLADHLDSRLRQA